MKIYSVYDKKSAKYSPVMCFVSDIAAIRAVQMDFLRVDGVVAAYPHDFSLHRLGDFDEDTGLVEASKIENIFEFASALVNEEK